MCCFTDKGFVKMYVFLFATKPTVLEKYLVLFFLIAKQESNAFQNKFVEV